MYIIAHRGGLAESKDIYCKAVGTDQILAVSTDGLQAQEILEHFSYLSHTSRPLVISDCSQQPADFKPL